MRRGVYDAILHDRSLPEALQVIGDLGLTGIRLDDIGLIMEGAVPAALLALAMQGVFEIIERALTPRGLRLRAKA